MDPPHASVPHKLKSILSEDLGLGSEAPWVTLEILKQTKNYNGPLQVEHAKMEIQ